MCLKWAQQRPTKTKHFFLLEAGLKRRLFEWNVIARCHIALHTAHVVETEKSILVVDDDYDIRDAICLALSAENYSVQVAPSREAAWALIQAQPPAIILLDWFMPGMSLETFVEDVRRDYPGIRVVLISAAHDLNQKVAELGIPHSLAKPFEVIELLQVVRECMDARK